MSLTEAVLSGLGLPDLPVLEVLPELQQSLSRNVTLCALEAPPGSGKTLVAPLWLAERVPFRRVLVLVPRRVNARLPVLFLEPVCGRAVGYRIRFESRWDEKAIRVGYLTYGTALRSFVENPPGADDLVILDEFHERPWEADLLLASLRSRSSTMGGPRLLLMSATLDGSALPPQTPIVRSDGRLHPVEVSREKVEPAMLLRPVAMADLVARRSAELAGHHGGGEQLIFLPGIAAIRAVQDALQADALGGPVDVLHSSLPEEEIRRVVERPRERGFRRILSTDLAESSVTLPGVTTVIDVGLQRRPRRDPFGLGITLETVRAPLASLSQRAGRAGRLAPGRCHRLFTHQDELHRAAFGRPEILQIDGKSLALHLASLGLLRNWPELEWLESPDHEDLEQGVGWLNQHGLVDGSSLNRRGQLVLRSACSARVGLFALLASEAGWPLSKVIDFAYAMDAGPGRDGGVSSKTLSDLLADRAWSTTRDQRLLQRLRDTFGAVSSAGGGATGNPLLKAFADTLVELRGDRALPRKFGAEALAYKSPGKGGSGYAVVLATIPAGREGPSSQVSLYQPILSEAVWEDLLDDLQESSQLEWDDKAQAVKEIRRTTLDALVLENETLTPRPGPRVAEVLARHLNAGDFGEDFAAMARRLGMFLAARPDLAEDLATRLPSDFSDPISGLLRGYFETLTRWSKTAASGLIEHCKQMVGYSTWRTMETALPSSVTLPGRNRSVAIQYPEQGSPFVASKLQDFFGWKPPLLLDGRIKLACHLLAPSGRPVQITEDLEGFWKGSYQQVRKDLRGRYPKHAWPEDPDAAIASPRRGGEGAERPRS